MHFAVLSVLGLLWNSYLSSEFIINIKCPQQTLWRARGKDKCKISYEYHCLVDGSTREYVEKCSNPKLYRKGLRIVLNRNLDAESCSHDRFSPQHVKSNEGFDCPFIKSYCNDEGQVTVNNGTPSTDRSCRCDYKNGYAYVNPPNNPCECIPQVEDCSCYRKLCDQSRIISQDYECISRYSQKETKEYVCGPIENEPLFRNATRPQDDAIINSKQDSRRMNGTSSSVNQNKEMVIWCITGMISFIVVLSVAVIVQPCCSVAVIVQPCCSESCADTEPKVEGIYYQLSDMQVVSYFEETKQISEIKKAFEDGNDLVILRGIPGSGKTQAAHYYCTQQKSNYSIVAKIETTDSDSMIKTLKGLANNIQADGVRKELDTNLTIPILCQNIKTFLNDPCRSTLKYLIIVGDARVHEEKCNLEYVLSLAKEVKNLDMIMTTYDSRFEKNYDSIVIQFNGMEKEEYTKLLKKNEKKNENGSGLKISDGDIEKLISQIGKLPIVINYARQYLITTKKSVEDYLETVKSLEQMDKFITIYSDDNISYGKELLDSLRVSLRDVKLKIEQKNGPVLWDVMMLLPFLDHSSVSTTVLEACYFHLPNSDATKTKYEIDSLLIKCERFSLCHTTTAQQSKFNPQQKDCDSLDMQQSENTIKNHTFNEVVALGLIDEDKEFLNDKNRRFEFLLKTFCFEIDIDARTDITLQRNILFLPHARKLLREIEKSNVKETEEILFYKSYLHCAIGSTYLFERTDIEAAHIHLGKSRRICLKIVDDKSCFTKIVCISQQDTSETIEKVAELVFQKEFDAKFVQDFVLGMRRSYDNLEAIKKTAKHKSGFRPSNGHYLKIDEYNYLVNDGSAIPIDALGKLLLGELLLRILLNNGRVLNELHYSIFGSDEEVKLQGTVNTECNNANEFCKLFKKQHPCHLLFVCLENDRTGRLLMRYSQTSISTSQIDSDIVFYKNMIAEPFDRCFNFGVLKMSRNFNDYQICMSRLILLRYLQLKYEKENDWAEKVKIFKEGRTEVQSLQTKIKQMETENRNHTWLLLPLFHIKCAKVLLLSEDNNDIKEALKLFEKATKLEESRGIFWTRYIHEGYHGSRLCLHKLERQNEADKMIKTIEEKYPNEKASILLIKNMEYKRWC